MIFLTGFWVCACKNNYLTKILSRTAKLLMLATVYSEEFVLRCIWLIVFGKLPNDRSLAS
jgi:hypothetical protein